MENYNELKRQEFIDKIEERKNQKDKAAPRLGRHTRLLMQRDSLLKSNDALLEACKTALASLSRGDCQDIAVKMLRQAINQATK